VLIDGKPLFTFYDLGNFVAQQGGVEGAKETIRRMREAVVAAGFPGIWIVAETRNIDPNAFYIMETIGLDASFPYCVPVVGGMENDEAIASIIATSEKIDAVSKLPSIATASVSWAVQPWIEYIDYPWPSQPWWINPPHYRTLLETMKARIDARPGNNPLAKKGSPYRQLERIRRGPLGCPTRKNGFRHLNAIRDVFAPDGPNPPNVMPQDVGLQPDESAHKAWVEKMRATLPPPK